MQNVKKTFIASAIISELQSSDIYLTVKARLFDLKANLNGVRVTEAFLDEIVEHEDKYITIPLCADVRGLLSNRTIGHMLDTRTGEYHSTAIGAFYHFEKEVTETSTYLIGYARIMKRNKAVCRAISELFADNALKFSFEISSGEYQELSDGTIVIDVGESNFLEGAAVVTFPACKEATALELVAECFKKGDENMTDINEVIAAEAEEQMPDAGKEKDLEQKKEMTADTTETNAATSAEVQTAEVVVEQTHVDVDQVEIHDWENHEHVEQRTETMTTIISPLSASEKDPKEKGSMEESKEAKIEEDATCKKRETASIEETMTAIVAAIEKLTAEVLELKKAQETEEHVIAEASEEFVADGLTVNPFIAEICTPKNTYSLLEREEKATKFTLID